MIVNQLDKRLKELTNQAASFDSFQQLISDLEVELRQTFQKGPIADILNAFLKDCAEIVAGNNFREWDEIEAENLRGMIVFANQSPEYRSAKRWADEKYFKEPLVRLLSEKEQCQHDLVFEAFYFKSMDVLAFRLLKWLTARKSLVEAYRNR